ncbi:hypothetical protein [Aquimarina sp. RZ0]|uniref:hypothetical protein n=1 Tax=Aquimarina sp. RZ0 TaxID=2607730 RepID=UPI0011F1262F|nr:hypothetical protein [Aquimarina sp. RZ0]KAA1245059.1 hypothetical protein F0000_13700 [Aquimarina sp. RZ0]
MKTFFALLLGCLSFISFGQEKPSYILEWQELSDSLSEENVSIYTITQREIVPSLSFIKQYAVTENYQLMEVDLTKDIRKQHLRPDTPMLRLPENKFIQSDYTIAIPTATNREHTGLTISGSAGGYGFNGYNFSTNNTGIKNSAYKDASLYTGVYCPVTGLPLN